MTSIKRMTTARLWAAFREAARLTSTGIGWMAEIYAELKNRGEDVSRLNVGLGVFLADVASGKLLPEIVVQFGGDPALVRSMTRLVPEEQAKLATPEARIPVLIQMADGTRETREIRPEALAASQRAQVFGAGRIRTPAEQRRYLPKLPKPVPTPVLAPAILRGEFNLFGVLTPPQRAQLTVAADQRGLTVAGLVADVLVRNKIITADHLAKLRATGRRRLGSLQELRAVDSNVSHTATRRPGDTGRRSFSQ